MADDAITLLRRLTTEGRGLRVDADGRLRVTGPLADADRQAIARHRDALVELVAAHPGGECHPDPFAEMTENPPWLPLPMDMWGGGGREDPGNGSSVAGDRPIETASRLCPIRPGSTAKHAS